MFTHARRPLSRVVGAAGRESLERHPDGGQDKRGFQILLCFFVVLLSLLVLLIITNVITNISPIIIKCSAPHVSQELMSCVCLCS